MISRIVVLRIMAIWAIVWPLATVGLFALSALAPDLPMPLKTLVLSGFLVPAMSLVIVPFVGRRIPS